MFVFYLFFCFLNYFCNLLCVIYLVLVNHSFALILLHASHASLCLGIFTDQRENPEQSSGHVQTRASVENPISVNPEMQAQIKTIIHVTNSEIQTK